MPFILGCIEIKLQRLVVLSFFQLPANVIGVYLASPHTPEMRRKGTL